MKVILINGSPHKNGCTNRALEEIAGTLLTQGINAEIHWLGQDAISGCRGCGACAKLGKCIVEDKVNELAPLIREADGVVFGSPVHYAAASGAITSFMDRLFYSSSKALAGKPALILADEPTGALDSKSGVEIMQMLHELHGEGNTIIVITHDLSIAKQAERIVTIKDGLIVSDVDNSNDRQGADNVKASDLADKETKSAEMGGES